MSSPGMRVSPSTCCSVDHGLTRTWSVLLSLVCTWFAPLPVCDHLQGVYIPPNRRWSTVFRVLFQQTNRQTNEDAKNSGWADDSDQKKSKKNQTRARWQRGVSRWYGRLHVQKLTLSVLNCAHVPGKSFHKWYIFDQFTPSLC